MLWSRIFKFIKMENVVKEFQKQLNKFNRFEIIYLNIDDSSLIYQTRSFKLKKINEYGYLYRTTMVHLADYLKIIEKLIDKELHQNESYLHEVTKEIKTLSIIFSTQFELTDNATIYLSVKKNNKKGHFIREVKNEAVILKTQKQLCKDFKQIDYLEKYDRCLFDIEKSILSSINMFHSQMEMVKMLDEVNNRSTNIDMHLESLQHLETQLEKVDKYKDEILRKYNQEEFLSQFKTP